MKKSLLANFNHNYSFVVSGTLTTSFADSIIGCRK